MTRDVIADHNGHEVYRRDVLPLPDETRHNHGTYIEGCWGCVLTLTFAQQAERVRRRREGLCVRGCDDERSDGPFCARCGNERYGEVA